VKAAQISHPAGMAPRLEPRRKIMATHSHYDVIIIGSGADGGTLAHKLAPTGKKILILERGGYVPREKDNLNPPFENLVLQKATRETM